MTKVLCFNPEECERIFAGRVQDQNDVAKMTTELQQDVKQHKVVFIEVWRFNTPEERLAHIAKRRREFFQS